ncbi:hypothetical protein [Hymenobacter psychrotolerans]|uniref:Uncharacterized protein n=1 Tax=Hymenobacter psychrotolerans DSM 18569 TaxID=1121959 RepID=A0A1M7E746_9BACT|nr:hypothetical protein [Hymenobacter psychrotolerans]SHL87438.1 hypothetical protein SAMN02746009_03535 [Hymenobacter psychrotolerans DSM 18569]
MADKTEKEETRQPTIESLTAENTRLQGELELAQGIIAGQAEQLANVETAQQHGDVVVVSYGKQQYRVLAKKFHIKGAEVKAEDLGKNQEALKHLVESKSGLLAPVAKAEAAK